MRFLGLPCMLWINMYMIYAFVSMTKTSQNKMDHHQFLFLTQIYFL